MKRIVESVAIALVSEEERGIKGIAEGRTEWVVLTGERSVGGQSRVHSVSLIASYLSQTHFPSSSLVSLDDSSHPRRSPSFFDWIEEVRRRRSASSPSTSALDECTRAPSRQRDAFLGSLTWSAFAATLSIDGTSRWTDLSLNCAQLSRFLDLIAIVIFSQKRKGNEQWKETNDYVLLTFKRSLNVS